MNRYIKANDQIHASEELKHRVVGTTPGDTRGDKKTNESDNCIIRRKRHRRWAGPIAAILVLAVIVSGGSGLFTDGKNTKSLTYTAYAISEAEYPEMAPYPDESEYIKSNGEFDDDAFSEAFDKWWDSRRTQQDQPEGFADGFDKFFKLTAKQFLSGDAGKNKVYSPLNIYMALAMLSETADGNSRQQINDLLGTEDMETLRMKASALWNANYCDDGAATSILSNSLWLNDKMTFVQDTMDTLADIYYASSYSGEMGSEKFNAALRDWINNQTGGMLEQQAEGLALEPDTVMALASTIYFKAKWNDEFSAENTKPGKFHSPAGDVECDFMNADGRSSTYFWGDRFSAVRRGFEDAGSMWLILPDEGVTPEELACDDEVMQFLKQGDDWEKSKYMIVNISMPKFDISSDIELKNGLEAMGVQDIFDAQKADFSAMTRDAEGIYLSKARHAARVQVDEEGCSAAAFTVMAAAGSGMPPEDEIDFVLDRPFMFVITGSSGQQLFAGIVNEPNL